MARARRGVGRRGPCWATLSHAYCSQISAGSLVVPKTAQGGGGEWSKRSCVAQIDSSTTKVAIRPFLKERSYT